MTFVAPKVVSLAEAIKRHIRPGQVIHAGNGWGFPTALLYEIVRQFWGRDPGFTLVVAGAAATNAMPFLRGGLVSRVISSFAGDGYPNPAPNPIIQAARKAAAEDGAAGARTAPGSASPGPVVFEDWSLLTFTLRLAAGAMGLPWLPTRSLLGSDLGRDLEAAGLFRVVDDPFAGAREPAGTGETPGPCTASRIGLVKALRPDVSLTHAWAADEDGNALFTLPLAAHVYGALAATEGAIVSVERVVDRAYVAAHSDLVRLPAHRVLAVVEAPFGAHPSGLHHQGLRGLRAAAGSAGAPAVSSAAAPAVSSAAAPTETERGYAEDRDFILGARAASHTSETADAWIREWILDLPDHAAYLGKLGRARLEGLRAKVADASAPRADITTAGAAMPTATPPSIHGPRAGPLAAEPTPAERLMAIAAGVVAEEVRRGQHPTVLAGVGSAHLACWVAREELAASGVDVAILAEVGLAGHEPRAGDPFVFALWNVPTAVMTTDVLEVLGILVPAWKRETGSMAGGTAGERGRHCLGVIGAAQVDRWGNVNTSGAPAAGLWLVGSGGANDVASSAAAVIVVAAQSATRFVPEVPYVTSPGERVVAIVSQWGVFRRRGVFRRLGDRDADREFALAAYYDDPSEPGAEAAVRRIREKCGWDLKVFPPGELKPLPPIPPSRVERLRAFDPAGDMRL